MFSVIAYVTLSMSTACSTSTSVVKESWVECKTVSLVCSGLLEASNYKFRLTATEIDNDGNIVDPSTDDVSKVIVVVAAAAAVVGS